MRKSALLVVVFAKAPQPGRVKTRLAQSIGPQAAARLHLRLVERTLATALAAGCGTVELHGSPSNHHFLREFARRYGIGFRGQAAGDVGARMSEAFRRGLRSHRRMLLVGSDCPALTPADFRCAARLLRGCDAVIAPAEDGGYPLIGLKRSPRSLFKGVEWSTATVMQQTRERLAALGWRWRELRTVWDVDRPEDLARLRATCLLERRP